MISLFRFTVVMLLVGAGVTPLLAQTPLWGPEIFPRETGEPVTVVRNFSVPDSTWEYTMVVQTGDSLSGVVRSAVITVNGEVVFDPSEFNQNVTEIIKPILLQKENEMAVRVTSIPGTALTISILGPYAIVTITQEGGTIALNEIAEIIFPAGAFESDNSITVWVTSCSKVNEDYGFATAIFDAGPRIPYELRVNTGLTHPLTDYEVVFYIPDTFVDSLHGNLELVPFVQLYQDGGNETLDHLVRVIGIIDSTAGTVHITLPWWTFTDRLNPKHTFEALILYGSTKLN
jgi:hypothetical protein